MLDTAYHDLESLRDKLQTSQEKLFDVGLYLTLYGDSEKEMDRVEQEIKSILESRLIFLRPALFKQQDGFQSVIPLGDDILSVAFKTQLSSPFKFFSVF